MLKERLSKSFEESIRTRDTNKYQHKLDAFKTALNGKDMSAANDNADAIVELFDLLKHNSSLYMWREVNHIELVELLVHRDHQLMSAITTPISQQHHHIRTLLLLETP